MLTLRVREFAFRRATLIQNLTICNQQVYSYTLCTHFVLNNVFNYLKSISKFNENWFIEPTSPYASSAICFLRVQSSIPTNLSLLKYLFQVGHHRGNARPLIQHLWPYEYYVSVGNMCPKNTIKDIIHKQTERPDLIKHPGHCQTNKLLHNHSRSTLSRTKNISLLSSNPSWSWPISASTSRHIPRVTGWIIHGQPANKFCNMPQRQHVDYFQSHLPSEHYAHITCEGVCQVIKNQKDLMDDSLSDNSKPKVKRYSL